MNITLEDLKAILCNDAKARCASARDTTITGQHIVVLDRGFVYVGDVTIDGDFLRITDAKNIRYWGTKNGCSWHTSRRSDQGY